MLNTYYLFFFDLLVELVVKTSGFPAVGRELLMQTPVAATVPGNSVQPRYYKFRNN